MVEQANLRCKLLDQATSSASNPDRLCCGTGSSEAQERLALYRGTLVSLMPDSCIVFCKLEDLHTHRES